MGFRSTRPPNGIPTARQPAVDMMVTEQDYPPPPLLVLRHWTDGGHGANMVDKHWSTGPQGLYGRGRAHRTS
eukprot:3841940-Rhodomonas_salina.1